MTFMDVQELRRAGSFAPSPDGQWLLYTVSTPDWKEARRQSDIFLVSLREGVGTTKQMTYTTTKNETSPVWSPSGGFFIFSSNREAPANSANQQQLYLMRPDGGEARRITDAKEGVSNFAFSRDGRWLVYRSGKSGAEQLYRLATADLEGTELSDVPSAEQLTKQPAGITRWEWSPDSRRIYFTTPDSADTDETLRREKRFTVAIQNLETPLWMDYYVRGIGAKFVWRDVLKTLEEQATARTITDN
jgi:Tol biopolymer transport system component